MQLGNYLSYASSFSRQRAALPVLSYLVLPVITNPTWESGSLVSTDAGERIGKFVIYRLKLRTSR